MFGTESGGRDWNTEMVELQNATAIIKYREKFRTEKNRSTWGDGRVMEMVDLGDFTVDYFRGLCMYVNTFVYM